LRNAKKTQKRKLLGRPKHGWKQGIIKMGYVAQIVIIGWLLWTWLCDSNSDHSLALVDMVMWLK
jgi:hypothetical protein